MIVLGLFEIVTEYAPLVTAALLTIERRLYVVVPFAATALVALFAFA